MPGRDEEFKRQLLDRNARAKRSGSKAIIRAAEREVQRVARDIGPSARTPPNPEELERRREATLAALSERARKRERAKWLRPLGAGAVIAVMGALAGVLLQLGAVGWDLAPASHTRPIPARQISDLSQAAHAAGCQLHGYRSTEADHVHYPIGIRIPYKTNPPSYGNHYPFPISDGDYVGLNTPKIGFTVHALEHGRIEIQYTPTLGHYQVGQLEELFNQPAGPYGPAAYLLLFANTTRMHYAVATVAWGHILGCPNFNSRVFDAIRAFRVAYTLKAKEHAIGPE